MLPLNEDCRSLDWRSRYPLRVDDAEGDYGARAHRRR